MSEDIKACAVVLRERGGRQEILAFCHPLAGKQLVKGTIEAAETCEAAALRELIEESGVTGYATEYLGSLPMPECDQHWHFVLCRTDRMPEAWIHHTADGGGLDFSFFWHPLHGDAGKEWHPIFQRALAYIRGKFPQNL